MLLQRFLLSVLLTLCSVPAAFGQGADTVPDPFDIPEGPTAKGPEVTATLLADVEAVQPGKPFTAAIRFDHAEGWQSYWKNSGYIQLPPKFSWKLPEGFTKGPEQFGTPTVTVEDGKYEYTYEGTSYVLTEITPPATLAPGGDAEIRVTADYQFCRKGACKMAKPELSLKLPIATAAKSNEANAKILTEYREKHFPKPLTDWKVSAYKNGVGVQLLIEKGSGPAIPEKLRFLSALRQTDAQKPHRTTAVDDKVLIAMAKDADYKGADKSLPGILLVGEGESAKAYEIDPPLNAGLPPVAVDSLGFEAPRSLGVLLWFALLGGLILNLMPCVFPVIGIKIMDFVKQSGQDKWRVTVHGLIFSLGILVTFWLLSGTLLILRSRGEEVGWGFQLQNPWIVFGLVLLMFVFAMNMYGVFEVGTKAAAVGQGLAGKKGFIGSFFKGALAVIVSTPCSAPFLATALSAVITLPPAQMMLVFTFIALGLALPYLILSAFPSLIRKLPKPGPWMESFKQVMSFFLFGTAGYLLWVYGGLIDEFNLLYAILGLTMVGLAMYVLGRWCNPMRSGRSRGIGFAVMVALAAGGVWLGRPKIDTLEWQAWSPELQAQLIEEEKPFYIDFTARWCLTCQTNKASYKSSEVADVIRKKEILMLRGDWTDHNEKIREAIEGYGKTAIPVNVLYIPGQEKPEVLPELLTSDVVLSYLNKVPDKKKE